MYFKFQTQKSNPPWCASLRGVGECDCIYNNWIARKLFSGLFNELKTLNPDQYNGASLLGLRGIVIKSHGSADVAAVVNAIGVRFDQVDLATHVTVHEVDFLPRSTRWFPTFCRALM